VSDKERWYKSGIVYNTRIAVFVELISNSRRHVGEAYLRRLLNANKE